MNVPGLNEERKNQLRELLKMAINGKLPITGAIDFRKIGDENNVPFLAEGEEIPIQNENGETSNVPVSNSMNFRKSKGIFVTEEEIKELGFNTES